MTDLSRLILRPHRPEDYPQLAHLRWALRTEEGTGPAPAQDLQHYVSTYTDWLAASDQRGDTVHMIAEDPTAAHGETLQAVMTLRTVPKEPCPWQTHPTTGDHSIGYLTNCYVVPRWRNVGLGSDLLDKIIQVARANGMELVFVWPSDPAVRFYRRAGFEGSDMPLVKLLQSI